MASPDGIGVGGCSIEGCRVGGGLSNGGVRGPAIQKSSMPPVDKLLIADFVATI